MTVPKQTDCSSASLKIGEAAKSVLVAAKTALADGWQPGTDITAIAVAAMTPLISALAEVKDLGEDAKKPVTMGKSMLIPILEGVEVLVQD